MYAPETLAVPIKHFPCMQKKNDENKEMIKCYILSVIL